MVNPSVDIAKNSQNTADNLVGTVEAKPILKRGSDRIKTISGPEIVSEGTYSGNGWVVGNANYAEVGVAEVGSPTITSVRTRIVNFDNTHYEYFSTNVLKESDDTSEWGDGNVGIMFTSSSIKTIVSKSIFKDNKTTTKARLVAFSPYGEEVTDINAYVRSSTDYSWQSISLNTLTTLTNEGPELYYKLDNDVGSGGGWPTAWGTWGYIGSVDDVDIKRIIINYEAY